MLVDTDNLVTEDEFRAQWERYVAAVEHGNGPVVVTRDAKIVGVFLGPRDYESFLGTTVRELLSERETGPTVSHEEVRNHIRQVINRRQRPS